MKSCKTCIHSIPYDCGDVVCRRYPPVIVGGKDPRCIGCPIVNEDFLCGEHKPKKKTRK